MKNSKKKSALSRRLLWGGAGLGCFGSIASFFIAGFFMIAVVSAPVIAATQVWEHVAGLFGDSEWKNAVQQAANYHLPTDKENLLLYKPLYLNGTKVAEDDASHWLNYGRTTNTVYKPPQGKTVVTFDIGRTALIGDIFLVMACQKCNLLVAVSAESPSDPANPSHLMTPDEVGAYYTPLQNFPDSLNSGAERKAAANSIVGDAATTAPGGVLSGRFITLFFYSEEAESYLVQLLVWPPQSVLGNRSNALYSASPMLDTRYNAIYADTLAEAEPDKPELNEQAYYNPLVDAKPNQTYLSLYPVVGTNPPHAATRVSANDARDGYQKIYLKWQLHSYTVGKVQEVGISWLTAYPPLTVTSPTPIISGSTSLTDVVVIPTPPLSSPSYARQWKLYLLDSSDRNDQAILTSLFDNDDGSSLMGGETPELPPNRLLREFGDDDGGGRARVSSTGSLTGTVGVGDKRNTLVLVFEESSLDPTTLNLDPSGVVSGTTTANPALPAYEWLALGEMYLYEVPPPAPSKWPASAVYGGTIGGNGGPGGQFDIRYGTISADKIEEVLAAKPWRGILPGGYPDNQPPTPNKLLGMSSVFIELGRQYGINPAYALALSLKETEAGTTGYTVYDASNDTWGYNLYNISNHSDTGIWEGKSKCLISPHRFCRYASFRDSIEEVLVLLRAYATGQMLTSDGSLPTQKACPCTAIEQVLYWYAPTSENDTELYINQVKGWITDWGATNPGGSGVAAGGGGSQLSSVPTINQYDCSQYEGSRWSCATWADSTCGPASATMVINYMTGRNLRVADTLDYGGNNGVSATDGTYSWDYLTAMGNTYGFDWRAVSYGSSGEYLAASRDLTAQGQPMVINIVGSPYTFGHFMVIIGYDPSDDTYIVHDPANVTQPGNVPGIRQKWSSAKLGSYIEGRVVRVAIIITRLASAPAQAGK